MQSPEENQLNNLNQNNEQIAENAKNMREAAGVADSIDAKKTVPESKSAQPKVKLEKRIDENGVEHGDQIFSKEFGKSVVDYEGPRTREELDQKIKEIQEEYINKTSPAVEINKLIADEVNKLIKDEKDKFERYQKDTELNSEEKAQLVEGWQKAFLGKEVDAPADLDNADNSKLRKWLYETLMTRADEVLSEMIKKPLNREKPNKEREINEKLSKELIGIDDSLKMISKDVIQENNPAKKSELELSYLMKCRELFNKIKSNFVTKFDDLPVESNRPVYFEKSQEFVCGGATLLGFALLKRDGIGKDFYRGAPPGHAVEIVRLSDDRWCYADFANGIVRIINPTGGEDELGLPKNRSGKMPLLEFTDDAIIYEKVPLVSKEDTPSFYFGQGTGFTPDLGLTQGVDWPSKFIEFQQRMGFNETGLLSPVMEAEKDRLSNGVSEVIGVILKDFSTDENKSKIDEAIIKQSEQVKAKKEDIKNYILGNISIDLVKDTGITGVLAETIEACRQGLDPNKITDKIFRNKVTDQDFRSKVVNSIMAGMINKAS